MCLASATLGCKNLTLVSHFGSLHSWNEAREFCNATLPSFGSLAYHPLYLFLNFCVMFFSILNSCHSQAEAPVSLMPSFNNFRFFSAFIKCIKCFCAYQEPGYNLSTGGRVIKVEKNGCIFFSWLESKTVDLNLIFFSPYCLLPLPPFTFGILISFLLHLLSVLHSGLHSVQYYISNSKKGNYSTD